MEQKNNQCKKQWLTPDDLEKEFGFKKASQAIRRMNRQIPFSKIGKYVRYNRDEINEWIKSHAVPMIEE